MLIRGSDVLHVYTEDLFIHSISTSLFSVPPDMPLINDNALHVEVVANHPANLTCKALNGKPAPNITWVSGGVEKSEGDIITTAMLQVCLHHTAQI